MIKWVPIAIGVILFILVKIFLAPYELVGMLGVGFLVGYMANEGVGGGLVNSVITGIVGSIVETFTSSFLNSSYGMENILISNTLGVTEMTIMGGIISLVTYLVYYVLIMGITGAIGGALNSGH